MNEAVYHQDGSRIDYVRPPLMSVIEQLDQRQLAVESVAARLNVTLRDTEKNKEFDLVGVYLGDKNGDMRLRITATTHQLVLDMARHGDVVEVFLPRKGRYFRGKHSDLLNNQSELSLLAHAGSARDLFFPRAWTEAATERRVTYTNGREVVSVIEKPGIIRKKARRLTMAPESPVVEAVDVYDRFGREVGMIAYGDYVYPEVEVAQANLGRRSDSRTDAAPPLMCEGGMVRPGKITLCSHNGIHRLEMQIEEFEFNSAIDAAKYEVPLPENTKVLELGPALKRAGNLWD